MLLVWAFCLSPIPIVVLVALLPLWLTLLRSDVLCPALSGRCRLTKDGKIVCDEGRFQLCHVDRHWFWWVIRLECEGQSLLVWRDSCQDEDYRRLQRFAREWQTKQKGQSAPL